MEENEYIKRIFDEHERAASYKSSLGESGLYEQIRLNEKYYRGDQQNGVRLNSGNGGALRHNIVRRIGDYKRAVILSDNFDVRFDAAGIAVNDGIRKAALRLKDELCGKKITDTVGNDYPNELVENVLALNVTSELFKSAAKNCRLNMLLETALKNAYISGSGVVYTYWDGGVNTGFYADELNRTPILGDIKAAVIGIADIDFGDCNECDINRQPYIIIAEKMSVSAAREEAKLYGADNDKLYEIQADFDEYNSEKCTVLTKLFMSDNEKAIRTVHAVRVCKNAIIRPEWDMGLRRYPISIIRWDEQSRCAYGDTELNYLIPNQNAINRLLNAAVSAAMLNSMPIMLVNGDVIKSKISNKPGQIVKFSGDCSDFESAIKYVQPPHFSDNYNKSLTQLIDDTLDLAGASRAALGVYEMNNASAIENLQRANSLSLNMLKGRYKEFVCDIASVFAEFFACCYGKRKIVADGGDGDYVLPFDGDRLYNLQLSVSVDDKKALSDEKTEDKK